MSDNFVNFFIMPNTVGRRRTHYIEIICCVLLLFFVVPIKIGSQDEVQFQKYLQEFNKSYDNATMYQIRLEAFKNSLKEIGVLNLNHTNGTAQYGLTKFSDMLPEEFLESNLLPDLSSQLKRLSLLPYVNLDLNENSVEKVIQAVSQFNIPQKVDWREKNVVTEVQNQDVCSACWAFAAVGLIESMYAIKTGKVEKFSIQQMIDCAKDNDGCDGGNMCALLNWMKAEQVKVVREAEYPLTYATGKCRNVSSSGVQIRDYACDNFVGSEEIILALIAKNGPVAVAINALPWQHYVGGTIQFHCNANPFKLNHAVQLVGYDLTSDVPHYIARNSWGKDFGDNGYLHLAIGKNICGLAHEVSVLTLL